MMYGTVVMAGDRVGRLNDAQGHGDIHRACLVGAPATHGSPSCRSGRCGLADYMYALPLSCRFGHCYQNPCMPLDLELAASDDNVSLDDQLLGMHQAFSAHLQMVAPTTSMASPSVGFGFGV